MPGTLTRLAAACGVVALLASCSSADEQPAGSDPVPSTAGAHDTAAGDGPDGLETADRTDGPGGDTGQAPPSDGTDPTSGPGEAAPGDGISPADVDLSALTDSWPCGYAFELSAPDGSASLVLEWTVPEAAIPRLVTLPDPRWEGRLLLGEGLGAVSCTPRTEPAGLSETWEVPAGTIRFQDGGVVPQGSVRASLTGVLAKAPDGTWLELPNQEVVNQGWGVTYDDMG